MDKVFLKGLKKFLDDKVVLFNNHSFISSDPIQIPKEYSKLQDIEITAFWTAILSWGNRTTIINKARELFAFMDNAPHDFILHHQEKDLIRLADFKHRTFQSMDTLYFIHFLKHHYFHHSSLEDAFLRPGVTFESVKTSLDDFQSYFFSLDEAPHRTRKHISAPASGSTCKRLNMFLRWMVRQDINGVDFGLWHRIPQHALMIPLDIHVERIARNLGILHRKQIDWMAVEEITSILRKLDKADPVKYDFALFGMGVNNKIMP